MSGPRVFAGVGLLLALTACSSAGSSPAAQQQRVSAAATPAGSPSAAPSPSQGPTSPSPPPVARSPVPTSVPTALGWQVGASPLPLRPDGFGQVLTTPAELRQRRLTSPDTLPAPRGEGFQATVAAVSPSIRDRMGQTWSRSCPIALPALRYLTVSYRGFDGAAHTGELVVAASVAEGIVQVFRTLYDADFPIESMRLPTTADLEAAPTGDGNNTAAYVCRAARGQTRWSQHAYGLAVDVNPFQNPDKKRDLVLPELASAYVDRADVRPGMIEPAGPVVRAFAAIGWRWGGNWHSSKDWMHFSANGT